MSKLGQSVCIHVTFLAVIFSFPPANICKAQYSPLNSRVYMQNFITNRYDPKTKKLIAVIIGEKAWIRDGVIDAEDVEISLYTEEYGTIKIYMPDCRIEQRSDLLTCKSPVRMLGHEIDVTATDFKVNFKTKTMFFKSISMSGLRAQQFIDSILSSPSSVFGFGQKSSKNLH